MEAVPVLLRRFALALEDELVVLHRELDIVGIDPGEVRFDAEGVPLYGTFDLRDISRVPQAPRHSGPLPVAEEEAEDLIYIAEGIEAAEGDVPSGQCFHHFV